MHRRLLKSLPVQLAWCLPSVQAGAATNGHEGDNVQDHTEAQVNDLGAPTNGPAKVGKISLANARKKYYETSSLTFRGRGWGYSF